MERLSNNPEELAVRFKALSKQYPDTRLSLLFARAAEDTRDKEWIKWGEEDCPHRMMPDLDDPNAPDVALRHKSECPLCWAELKEELKS